jgi:site-specific recombinase XerD
MKLIDSAGSYRDKAILMLLSRAGQRIGDWNPVAGRHGILGMELGDVDRKRRFITVRLKGARDQHRVPVTDDFWPIYEEYLRTERLAAVGAGGLESRGLVIDKREILEAASSFSLLPNVVEKDYVLGWILGGINAHEELAESW